jgi:hypothetical protein
MSEPKAGTCPACGRETPFEAYVYAHWDIELVTTCDCGVSFAVKRGISYELSQRKKSRRRKTDAEGQR